MLGFSYIIIAALLGKRVIKPIDLMLDNNNNDNDNISPLLQLYSNRRVNRQNNNIFPVTNIQAHSSALNYF